MTGDTAPAPLHRALGITAAVLGVSTPVTLAIGWALAASAPGMEGLGIAVYTLFAIALVGLAALVVGIVAVVRSRPRWVPVVGLVVTVATLLFVVARFLLVS